MSTPRVRVVLHESVSRDGLERAAAQSGWLLANIVPASALRPFQIMFLTSDELNVVHFVDDTLLGAKYVVARGSHPEQSEREIRDALPSYSPDDVRRMIERPVSRTERVRGLRYAGLLCGAGLEPGDVADLVRTVFGRGEPEVELAALETAVASGVVPALLDLVKKAKGDRDRAVRDRAAEILDAFSAARGAVR